MNVPKAVAESYLDLAAARSDVPTIDEVLSAAGVTEAEFRMYFTDLQEVVMASLEEMLWMLQGSNMPRRLDEGAFGPDAARSICDDIVARLEEAWRPVTIGVRHHRAVIQFAIGRAIQQRAAAYFQTFPGFRAMEQPFLDASSHYVGHGLAAIAVAWVAADLDHDAAAVANHMADLLPAWLVDPRTIGEVGSTL